MVNLKGSSKKVSKKFNDFQKVKHRVGKLKPGAINKTDTTVKSQRLYIRSQAMSRGQKIEDHYMNSEPNSTTLQASLSPLWSLCRHHNHLQRRDSYKSIQREILKSSNIKDIIAIYPDLISLIGKGLMDRQSPLVRRAVSDLLFSVMPHTPSLIEFSHETFLNHLLMAMTHIDSDIKKDSLLLFERILMNYNGNGIEFLLLITQNLQASITERIIGALRLTNSSSSLLKLIRIILKNFDDNSTPKNELIQNFSPYTARQIIPLSVMRRLDDEFVREKQVLLMKIKNYKEGDDLLVWIIKNILLDDWRSGPEKREECLLIKRDIEIFFEKILSITGTAEVIGKILK